MTAKEMFREIDIMAKRNDTKNIVLSGGDPLAFNNMDTCQDLLVILKNNGYNVTVYTGYDITFVEYYGIFSFDYIKCGKFDSSLYQEPGNSDDKFVLASTNQNFYNSKYEQVSENGILYY